MFNRKKKQNTVKTVVRHINVQPDLTSYVNKDELVETLLVKHFNLAMEVEPYLGKDFNREFTLRKLGQMREITEMVALLRNQDMITATFQVDKDTYQRQVASGFYEDKVA